MTGQTPHSTSILDGDGYGDEMTRMRTMKMWIGNLDGDRAGLVIAPSKARARQIVGASRGEFDGYWVLQSGVDQSLEFEVLYTRPIDDGAAKWQQGRCPRARTAATSGKETR